MLFWFFLFAILTILFIVWFIDEYFVDLWFVPIVVVLAFLATLLLFFVGHFVADIFGKVDYKVQSDVKIVALENNQGDSEDTFVGIGHTGFGTCYYYLEETEVGYNLHKVSAQNTQIRYTDGEPHVETMVGEFENKRLRYLFFESWVDTQYIIYCPEGTVGSDLVINLE